MTEYSLDDVLEVLSEPDLKPRRKAAKYNDYVRPESPDMLFCSFCGFCEDPRHCVWSVQCPECCAPPMQQCLDGRGGVTGLHEERWSYARRRQ